jgi:hypothetical protein
LDDRVVTGWRGPLLGAALVALGLLTVSVRSQGIAEARELHVAEVLRDSLQRRLDDLAADLTAEWQQLEIATKGDDRP